MVKEILMTEEIWSILESMNDYEKLYLTYLVQGLTLNKLDFIHRGMLKLYEMDYFKTIPHYLLTGLIKLKRLSLKKLI